MADSRSGRQRRFWSTRALAAIAGGLAICLAMASGLRSVDTTEANWRDEVYASASLNAATLGPVQDLDCEGGGLLGLFNSTVTLYWEPPYEGFNGIYEVAWAEQGLSTAADVLETNGTEYEYSIPTSIIGAGAIVAVRPVLGHWKGESKGHYVSTLSVVGLGLRTSCEGLIPDLLNIFDPAGPDGLLAQGNDASALQVAEATIDTSPTTAASSTADSTSPAATTSTVPDGPEEETTTSTSRVSQTGPSTSSTTSTRLSQSPVPESTSQTGVPTSTRSSTVEPTRRSRETPTPSVSSPPSSNPTTSKSQAPTTVIPSEPSELSSTARREEVGTIEINDEPHDVVVRGTHAPADARTAAAALDTWINDGTRPTGDWKTFTSDDPDEDGWRWAAINQVTGTVVYIR